MTVRHKSQEYQTSKAENEWFHLKKRTATDRLFPSELNICRRVKMV